MSCFRNSRFGTRLLTALLSIVSLATVCHSQHLGPLLQVSVPFDFEDGSRRFPAGVYFIRMEADHRLVIEGSGSRSVRSIVPEQNAEMAPKNKVVFRRYGERYFLREVWVAGQSTHVNCPATRMERQVEVALNAQNKPGVMVALLGGLK